MEAWWNTMKISIPQLQRIIQEELEAELLEKKKRQKGKKRAEKVAKRKKKKKKSDLHFGPSQSPAKADKTFHQCMIDADVDPDPGVDLETAKARVCTDTRKASGATLDWGEEREKEVEKARPGGESGK